LRALEPLSGAACTPPPPADIFASAAAVDPFAFGFEDDPFTAAPADPFAPPRQNAEEASTSLPVTPAATAGNAVSPFGDDPFGALVAADSHSPPPPPSPAPAEPPTSLLPSTPSHLPPPTPPHSPPPAPASPHLPTAPVAAARGASAVGLSDDPFGVFDAFNVESAADDMKTIMSSHSSSNGHLAASAHRCVEGVGELWVCYCMVVLCIF